MTKPNILITNDDGILAEGISCLAKALESRCDITIIAPAHEKSGSALSISMNKPLQIRPYPWEGIKAYSINGTPIDCIKLALSVLLTKPPDLIVSGINRGSNSGRNVLYSGTVGAIIEGTLRNVPGISFSSENYDDPRYAEFSPYIFPIVDYFLKNPIPEGSFINVSFPSHCKTIQGLRMSTQGMSYFGESPDKRQHPEGHTYYWLGGKKLDFDEEEESDVALLEKGYITATPIQISKLTDWDLLEAHKESFENLLKKKSH